MLEQLKYKNHQNEVFEFGIDGIFVNLNDLHDYEWTVQKKGNKISAFTYSIKNKKLPVIIMCDTEEKGIAAKNKLLEVAEKDVLAMQYGQVIIGDYYMKCYVTKSQKKDYLTNKRYMEVTLTLTTDRPYWVKEIKSSFSMGGGGSAYLDYSYDYPVDFCTDVSSQEFFNTGFISTNFKLIIYGACTNPTITIAGHTYQVNCTVGANEYLTIDSIEKRIYLTSNTGAETNKFNDRNKESYIFEKIPAGVCTVGWNGDFGFDIILLEERSEPKWI